MEIADIGRWFLVIFMYAFCLVVALVVVATLAQYLRGFRNMSSRGQNWMVFVVSAVFYLGFIFLVLNDWAADYLP